MSSALPAPAPAALKKDEKYKRFVEEKNKKKHILSRPPAWKRSLEYLEIGIYLLYLSLVGAKTISLYQEYISTTTSSPIRVVVHILGPFFGGLIVADFASGFIHWFCDTWGKVEDMWLGQAFFRSFREHHVDPAKMTRHDFITTNADSTIAGIMAFSWMHAADFLFPFSLSARCLLFNIFWWGSLFTTLTNQIHKWSHMYRPPAIVTFLQDIGLLLNRHHHNVHHKNPFDTNYCITCGWLNPPLNFIGFWRTLEAIITLVTGAKPRIDDKYWNSHLEILEGQDAADEDHAKSH